MRINLIQNKLQNNNRIKVQSKVTPMYNITNPMACDTFTPSVSFKANIDEYAKSGNLSGVKEELANGFSVNNQNSDGDTPLHRACYHNHDDVMNYLLQQEDIDINIVNNNRKTPLMKALDDGYEKIVTPLLERDDIDLTIKDDMGRLALNYASKSASYYDKLKELTEYQLANPETIGKKRTPAVDIYKLSPEENIWTEEQISKKFLILINDKKYDEATTMLQNTPLIKLDKLLLDKICTTGNSDFARKVFDNEKIQGLMREEYEAKRKNFLENEIKTMSYSQLKENQVALYTPDGFRVLMEKQEFNPNDMIEQTSLFDLACNMDPEGTITAEILSKYDDVNVNKWLKSPNKKIKPLVEEYATTGKYKLKFDNIKRGLINPSTRHEAIAKLKDFINSEEFKPEMTDTLGNSTLHIVSTIVDESSRGMIQKLLDKGVDVNAQNVTEQNPIMSAITALRAAQTENEKAGLLSNIKFLIDKGANIEDKDKNGQTVFHYVCSTVSIALLTMILAKEPNVLARDLKGNRAAKYLKTEEMKQIYQEYVNKL